MGTVEQRNGLIALRVNMGRCEPRTAQTQRVFLRNIVTIRQSTKVEDIDILLRNIKGYEDLAGQPLDASLLVVALREACVTDLRSKLG